ncbi:testis-specific serine/threonine-protein kinase 3-like isoform X2 [Bradysia coprophila]|uniref:testis-specific serine/threonine-protein kinase 3-like isoform X2 n=1 Tax=Bradysia coprophila TaxID=38358 RepID=UPI00187D8BAB|nr:testis-specific serine/threonine-protein kinase 3-like isoform X2 [Bradysia coprophila]
MKLSSSEKQTLTDRGYTLSSKIGEGAYSEVYLSTYKQSPHKLACKIVDVPKSSATYVNKFLPRELNILMSVKSPYIVHIHSIFRRNLKYFIFMRHAEKGDLMDWIIAHGAVSQIQSKLWGKQIVEGLQYLHQNSIAHRDLKCENILITARNNVKLTDFGFSRYITDTESDSKDDYNGYSETFCGSLLYVAPEIVRGVAYNPYKSDMWSLGVVIFTMLNCKVPFNETHPSIIYKLQMSQKYRFNERVNSDEVKRLIKRLLQPNPKERPSIDTVLADHWFETDTSTEGLSSMNLEDNSTEGDATNVKQVKEPNPPLVVIMRTDDSLDVSESKIDIDQPNREVEEIEETEDEMTDSHTGIRIISKSTINDA